MSAGPLSEAMVGVSISEPDDLTRHGLGEIHVRHAFVEVARHVLAAGASLAYGGDLRVGGYTEAMFDLVGAYEKSDRPGRERLRSYLAWPLWQDLRGPNRSELLELATLVEVAAPPGAPGSLASPSERDARERLWFARALSEMRRRMTADISARVVLGGKVAGQAGLCPGVLEEAALALRAGVPLFVIGAFGGCGQLLVRALGGERPAELTVEHQMAATAGYAELLAAARAQGGMVEPEPMAEELVSRGWAGLRNGLDSAENERLASTGDVDEVVALVLRGLRRIA